MSVQGGREGVIEYKIFDPANNRDSWTKAYLLLTEHTLEFYDYSVALEEERTEQRQERLQELREIIRIKSAARAFSGSESARSIGEEDFHDPFDYSGHSESDAFDRAYDITASESESEKRSLYLTRKDSSGSEAYDGHNTRPTKKYIKVNSAAELKSSHTRSTSWDSKLTKRGAIELEVRIEKPSGEEKSSEVEKRSTKRRHHHDRRSTGDHTMTKSVGDKSHDSDRDRRSIGENTDRLVTPPTPEKLQKPPRKTKHHTKTESDTTEKSEKTKEEVTSEKATSEKSTPEKATSEKATSEKVTPEKATSEKATSEKATSEKATSEKVQQSASETPDKVHTDKPEKETEGTEEKKKGDKPPREKGEKHRDKREKSPESRDKGKLEVPTSPVVAEGKEEEPKKRPKRDKDSTKLSVDTSNTDSKGERSAEKSSDEHSPNPKRMSIPRRISLRNTKLDEPDPPSPKKSPDKNQDGEKKTPIVAPLDFKSTDFESTRAKGASRASPHDDAKISASLSPRSEPNSKRLSLFLTKKMAKEEETEEESVKEILNPNSAVGLQGCTCAVFKFALKFDKKPLFSSGLRDGRECLLLQLGNHREIAICSTSQEMTTEEWVFCCTTRVAQRGKISRLGAIGKSILSFAVWEDNENNFDFQNFLDDATKRPKEPKWQLFGTPEADYVVIPPSPRWTGDPVIDNLPDDVSSEEDDVTILGNVKKTPDEIFPNPIPANGVIPKEDKTTQESKDRYLKRKHLALEILQTEKSYVNSMSQAFKSFYHPLIQESEVEGQKILIDKQQIETIFNGGNFELIYRFNSKLLDQIEKAVKSWKDDSEIGPLFEKAAPDLAIYTTYAQTYSQSIGLYHKLVEKSEIASKFDELRLASGSASGLSDILIMPIQRIPRYSLLIHELCKNTHPSHKDFLPLRTSLFAIMDVADNINEDVRRTEHFRKVTSLQERGIKMDSLVKPGRFLMKEGTVKLRVQNSRLKKDQEEIAQLMLFNDALVRVKKTKAKNGYDLSSSKYLWPLSLLWISMTDEPDKSVKVSLTGPNEVITFIDHDHWAMALTEQINAYLEKRGQAKHSQHALVLNGHRYGQFEFPKQGVYKGEWELGLRKGRGVWKFQGNVYNGFWKNDMRHGQGKFIFSSGDIYLGAWKKDLQNGQGILTRPDGSYCVGQWHQGQRHGRMKLHYANGDSYVGNWEYDLMHGEGRLTFSSGISYTGQWANSKFHGIGTITVPSGYSYTGDFKNGTKTGFGKIKYSNGSAYTGKVEDDLRHGLGLFIDVDGSIYDGFWAKDKPEGKGTRKSKDGRVYTGDWVMGFPHGQGSCVYPNGSFYVGQWDTGQRHGYGFFKDSDQSEYVGNWVSDGIEGKGNFSYASGARYDGLFHNGQFHKTGELLGSPGSLVKRYSGDFFEGQFHGKGEIAFSNGDKYKGGFKNGLFHGPGIYEFSNGTTHKGTWSSGVKNGKFSITHPIKERHTTEEVPIDRTTDRFSVQAFEEDEAGEDTTPLSPKTPSADREKEKEDSAESAEEVEYHYRSSWRKDGTVAGDNLLSPSFGFPFNLTPTLTPVYIPQSIDSSDVTRAW